MSITFRKRPDHTLSTPEAKEPHLDLHSIDAGQADALDDDDIPVLLPAEPDKTREAVRHTLYTPDPNRSATTSGASSANPDRRFQDRALPDHVMQDRTTPHDDAAPDRPASFLKREKAAVHIPPPPSVPRRAAAHTDAQTPEHASTHPSAHMPAPAAPQGTTQATHATHPTAQTPARTVPPAQPPVSAATQQRPPEIHSPTAAPELPGHPTTQDYAPFLNTAKNRQDPHNKPELYVWSDDENDAFAQVAKRDFTLNRIEPTAGRPSFDASLFRAPSRPQALASAATPASVADPATAMQAEIDALVTELLDESHDYLKRRFLEEIPEIIAKYRQN
ncbi:hypothetical protein W822_12955 [Advenella kashmirensis W13003]|uniref:Uncharacterized protein n=1 Tax=Advenella kashmirensis W13003 TaxID=1424334 RepID=V8QTL9_9BURK|nr:hypothetical protein [Advenella kashmirensis]ETF02354.1 hypothetical protein W822_12955 [Advenella kashmirensis W13003]